MPAACGLRDHVGELRVVVDDQHVQRIRRGLGLCIAGDRLGARAGGRAETLRRWVVDTPGFGLGGHALRHRDAGIQRAPDIQREPTARAQFAFDAELAAEHARQFTRNRQTEPGAAIRADGAGIDLLERLEYLLDTIGRYPDALIDHRNRQRVVRAQILGRE